MKSVQACPIQEISRITGDLYDLRLYAPEIARKAQPGQFLHIQTGGGLLRRPISICDVMGDIVRVIFAVRGDGTKALANQKAGEILDVLGPLGTGFHVEGKKPAVIGGGIGIFPLLFLCKQLIKPKIYLGFRTKEQMVLTDAFATFGEVHIATDDGSFGYHGRVTDLADKEDADVYYACGPAPMLRAVQKIAGDTPMQLSMEERMGCGIGGCAVCVCKVNGHYEKVCQKGPVFNGKELDLHD
ncbi:MAG: dihydroorotate dehydrogenase electron transfer subunit [Clostridia bacterium]|nr:dihydroorotate dehydrogenase electron transfer subunit [Clostridia bacterium]